MSTVSLDWFAYPPPEFTGGAVAIGNFDGVHLGHRALVNAAREQAGKVGGPAVAVMGLVGVEMGPNYRRGVGP